MIITLYRRSFGHTTYDGAVFHTWQFKQIGPSYTKLHVSHSLRTLIFFFGTRPFANFSNYFTV
jgi:hypothetical protein